MRPIGKLHGAQRFHRGATPPFFPAGLPAAVVRAGHAACIGAILSLATLTGACTNPSSASVSQPGNEPVPPVRSVLPATVRLAAPFAAEVAEASRRFDVPTSWILAVMHAESRGHVRAVSPKGAMGLMQIMPGTYAGLRARHGLGPDPFVPGDNILAGAAYLREMHDRFGSPGFLAAYNAGPDRYWQHLATGQALPLETRRYVATVVPLLGDGRIDGRILVASNPIPTGGLSREKASLDGASNSRPIDSRIPRIPPPPSPFNVDPTGLAPRSDGLFVRLASRDATP